MTYPESRPGWVGGGTEGEDWAMWTNDALELDFYARTVSGLSIDVTRTRGDEDRIYFTGAVEFTEIGSETWHSAHSRGFARLEEAEEWCETTAPLLVSFAEDLAARGERG